ncbi:MAG: sigma-54 interaction domain-containing protein [Candidatus Goldiibacteriota bacterium]
MTDITGKSHIIEELRHFIKKTAGSSLPILIEGESGTGKEVAASAIHKSGPRADMPFIEINCGAMPADLIENELFGHEAGAFTGATNMKRGLFEVADKGTLFIDEIGEMDILAQAKLLRVLETGRFRRLGGTKEIKTDVRIIAATNRILEDRIEKDKFRADLYYRLSVLRLFMPALRERKEDIPALVREHLGNKINRDLNRNEKKHLSSEAMAVLQNYTWPGNIRELFNAISRAALVSSEKEIKPSDLPKNLLKFRNTAASAEIIAGEQPLEKYIKEKEKEYLAFLYSKYRGDKKKILSVLKISRAKLYRKLSEYKLI